MLSYIYISITIDSCGINNTRSRIYNSIALEDPIILPKVICEKMWSREFQRLKLKSKANVYDNSFAKVLCTGNYRKVNYRTFEYSESTG